MNVNVVETLELVVRPSLLVILVFAAAEGLLSVILLIAIIPET